MTRSVFNVFGSVFLMCMLAYAGIARAEVSSDVSAAKHDGADAAAVHIAPENLSDISFKEKGNASERNIDSFKPGTIDLGGSDGNSTSLQKASAGSVNGTVLTLYDACKLAVDRHPIVASSRYSMLEREAEYGMARSVYYPRIDFAGQAGPSHNLDTHTTSYGQTNVALTHTVYNFGGLQSSVESARLKAEGAKYRLARTNEDIAALAINAYLSVLQSRENLDVYTNALDFYQKLLDTFWERYNAGISSKADAQKVEVSLRSAQSQITVQNQQLKTAKLLLENIIKQPVYEIDAETNLLKMDVGDSLEALYDRALENNVSLQAYESEINSQEQAIQTRESDYYPSFGYRLQAKSEFQKVDGYENSLDGQVTVNWNLFNGFSTDEGVKREQAVLKRLIATKQATELEVQNILSDAFNAYNSSEEEFKLAKEAYDSSVYLMSLYISEFDLGIRTLLDLITAREGQTSAAVREVNARFARIRAALNIYLEEGRLAEVLGMPLGQDPFAKSSDSYRGE